MKNNNKWTVRDVITTVLLTVALILIQLVINMVCMVNDFVSMVLSVGILWTGASLCCGRLLRYCFCGWEGCGCDTDGKRLLSLCGL